MIDISIIIPTYNRLWSLPETLASCRNTACSVEIIVIDDGSNDGTREWLQQQANLVVIYQSNSGKCKAVNTGFGLAKGRYIRFLDSDDVLNEKALDEQFEIIESEKADIVVSGYKLIDERSKILKSVSWTYCDDFIAQQLGECNSSHYSAYMFRKDFLENIRHKEEFCYRDDRMFLLEVALQNPVISYYDKYALLHRIHTNNKLQHPNGKDIRIQNDQHLKIYQLILNRLADEGRLTLRRKNAPLNILWELAHWIAKYNVSDGYKVVKWIYKLNPNFEIPEEGILKKLYSSFGFHTTEILLRIRRKLINV